ncbi:uncharacterized protein TRAVEDRAFT_80312, partial [Trametes versicolor FP-101664 SS1]|uniref:uncharacterized protein n=1 Tax=Trametes versicolor (strain FP-101664) TaxID=717944 RepID=UPI00046218DB
NTGVPINALPVELLAEVFKATQPKLGRESGERPWLAYLLVCRHWFTVGATTPRLWDFVYATPSLNYARTCLARSKGVKIDVIVVPDMPVAPVLSQYLQLVSPHVHRIRTLVLGTFDPADAPYLRALVQHPMPALELFT